MRYAAYFREICTLADAGDIDAAIGACRRFAGAAEADADTFEERCPPHVVAAAKHWLLAATVHNAHGHRDAYARLGRVDALARALAQRAAPGSMRKALRRSESFAQRFGQGKQVPDGLQILQISSGTCGARLVSDGQSPRAVYKAARDECSLRPNIDKGTYLLREVAAYRLDLAHGARAGVPLTAVDSLDRGAGSVQRYRDGVLLKRLPHEMEAELDPERLRAVALLDMWLWNADRHRNNVLVSLEPNGRWMPIPIDHGLILPTNIKETGPRWGAWQEHAAMTAPLSAAERAWIDSLDAKTDAAMLRAMGLEKGAVRTLQVLTWTLKELARSEHASPKSMAEALAQVPLRAQLSFVARHGSKHDVELEAEVRRDVTRFLQLRGQYRRLSR
jgi:hypothetical protein